MARQVGLRGPKTGSENIGKPLPEDKLEDFESQQIYQLYELRKSIAPIPDEEGSTSGASNSVDDDVKVRVRVRSSSSSGNSLASASNKSLDAEKT